MGAARVLCFLLLATAGLACFFLAAMSAPQVLECFQASRDAESEVKISRPDFIIHNLLDVRDQPHFVEQLHQWRADFKALEQRSIARTNAACSPLHVSENTAVLFAFVLLAAFFPGGGVVVEVWLLVACFAAAGIAMFMHQQHLVHSAFDVIIDDLRGTMSHHVLPLTNEDDHYLYSLIYASTALRKSEDTPHVSQLTLQLPGLGPSYELAPAHATICCALVSFLAVWLAASRFFDRRAVAAAEK
jgi:hypothetical protein